MIRRIVLAATAAAALILAPTVAVAAPLVCTASPSAPVVGQPVKVDCTGGTKNQRITLYIGTAVSQTKNLNATGVGTFSVKFTAPGPYTVTMKSAGTTLVTLPIQVSPKYPAPHYTFTLSDPTPTVSAMFGVNVSGVDASTAVTLAITSDSASVTDGAIVIAGTKSLQNTADAAGAVSFDVTIASAGVFTLVGTNAAGASVGSQKVTVGAIAAAPVVAPSDTGFGGIGLAIGAGLLILLLAAAFFLVARRRKSAEAEA